jgi:hypothetical protein
MDRHVIANIGAELGATTTVFPSDERTREFLRSVGRGEDWRPIAAEIDLSSLVPLIAKPSSPANVVPVREVAGGEIYQAYIGSSANPGFRDYAGASAMVKGRAVHDRVSFDINPTSRQTLQTLVAEGIPWQPDRLRSAAPRFRLQWLLRHGSSASATRYTHILSFQPDRCFRNLTVISSCFRESVRPFSYIDIQHPPSGLIIKMSGHKTA